MSNVLFSLIVTVYNIDRYLDKCISSILNQTYTDFELIIVDDGSTDGSGIICDRYARDDQRVHAHHQSNQGLVSARCQGISIANGEYVIFVDGDDWVDPQMCEVYAKYIDRWQPDIIIADIVKDYGNRSQKSGMYFQPGYYAREKIEKEIFPQMIYTSNFFEKGIESYLSGRAVKRSLLSDIALDIDKNISWAEGTVWIISCLLKCTSLVFTDYAPYHYRMRSDSMTINQESTVDIKDLYENLLKNIVKYAGIDVSLIRQLDYLAIYWLIWQGLHQLNNEQEEYLFPFTEAKRGSRVVLYGAWRFGRKLYSFIRSHDIYEIVLWVDQNAETYNAREGNQEISLPEKITQTEYDYILLGSVSYSVLQSMRKKLASMGITRNVLGVDTANITLNDLPNEFKIIKSKYTDRLAIY